MEPESSALNADNRAVWDANAEWWDDYIGAEGNDFHRTLVAPAQMRLLALKAGERVLDIACGNGQFTREMAQAGARVVAFDFSEKFVARAKDRTAAAGIGGMEFRVMDATDERALLALGERAFDAAVCTMALMDMAEIGPLMRALSRLLRPGGRFVFSVSHPCFQTNGTRMCAEMEDQDGELVTVYSVKVSTYLEQGMHRGIGIIGQPQPHFYFDRPLSLLLEEGFAAGFALDGLEEPAFEPGAKAGHPLGWANFPQIPPVLVARLRLL
jgi:SAM-dependent methyltransferase